VVCTRTLIGPFDASQTAVTPERFQHKPALKTLYLFVLSQNLRCR
jgi:hypothetical protein